MCRLRWLIWLACGWCSAVFACDVIDDAHHTVHLKQPAKRIISLAPDLTELLFAAGAGSSIVGVMQGSNYPAAARQIPQVANYNHLNNEAILALHPDLIVAWSGGSSVAQLQQLQRLGVPVFLSHQRDLRDIPRTLQKFGCLAGTEPVANQAARDFTQQYTALMKRYSRQKTVTVFYELWPHPLMTVNHESWIHQIILLCGGKNLFAKLHGVTPIVNLEAILAANPEVIISSATAADWKDIWQHWPDLQAVRNQTIYGINPDWLERAGPRLLLGAQAVCSAIDHSRQPH